MADVINGIDDRTDSLEDLVLTMQSYQLRPQISELRREAISLRRYLAPQREAMSRLYNERVPWLDDIDRMHLREVADRFANIKRKNQLPHRQPVVNLGICVGNIYKVTEVNLVNRSNFKYEMLIGRSFLKGNSLVDSSLQYTVTPNCTSSTILNERTKR